ncbi:unnamed protein product [Meganyctiphanes norvegica]|uniref:Cytochrome P450 n=1 Tax=Meganyctiphanes norvegica TaxID=48144 RepID=A0AAV2PZY0_MEGNR
MGWLKTSIFSWLGLMGVALFVSQQWVTWTLLITGITALAYLDHKNRGYWRKHGIITADGSVPIFGHLLKSFDNSRMVWEYTNSIYEKYKNSTYVGTYLMWSPSLLITDPEVVKQVTIKDFDHFVDRRTFKVSGKDKYANEMLTSAEGAHWKGIRSVLSPTFSSGKMKNMFPLVLKKADALMEKLHKVTEKGETEVDMKNFYGRLTVDVIGTCAFGFESNCIEDESDEFEKKLAKASNQGMEVIFQILLFFISERLADFLGFGVMARWKYFKDLLTHTIEQRRNSTIKRGDFLDLILEAQAAQAEPGSTKHEISSDTVIASSVIFLLAGYDTVRNTLVIAAHIIAQHQEEQEQLRQELQEIVEEHGSLNYQNVMEAKYLEAVIFETMRMYPLLFALERKCTKEYVLPGTNIKLEKDRFIQVPVWSLQNDELYWKEPSKFNPDRFLPENKGDIVQGTYLPFGLGPRNCIAQRFALMEVKVAVARLIQEFHLSLAPGREELGINKGPMMRPFDTMPLLLTPVS